MVRPRRSRQKGGLGVRALDGRRASGRWRLPKPASQSQVGFCCSRAVRTSELVPQHRTIAVVLVVMEVPTGSENVVVTSRQKQTMPACPCACSNPAEPLIQSPAVSLECPCEVLAACRRASMLCCFRTDSILAENRHKVKHVSTVLNLSMGSGV